MLERSDENNVCREMVESIWRRYSKQIYKLCEQKCETVDEARDLFQTVALKLCENVDRLLNRENMFPWLFSVLRHAYLDNLAASRRACPMSGVAEPAMEYGSFSEEESMYFEPDPTLEVVAFLEKMLSVLTPLERMVVEMKYYGGFSVREISNILGLSENAIRKRRYNAFQKIRRQLEDDSSVPKFAQ